MPDQANEVLRAAGQLEPDQIGSQQAVEDLVPPGQLEIELGGREGDVQEEPDPQVGPLLAQHLRHELELVVLHPHGRPWCGDLGGPVGEALVDPHVGVPPLAMELRGGDHVVVERPEGGVGETLVVLRDLLGGQRHGHQLQPVVGERLELLVRRSRPADPGPRVAVHDRLEGGHQTAGGGPPVRAAVRVLDSVDRQPVGHHHESGLGGHGVFGGRAHNVVALQCVSVRRGVPHDPSRT